MGMLRRAAAGLKALVGRRRFEQDLDAELRAFLEAAVEQKMRDGLSEEAARRDAEGIEHHVSEETLAAFEAAIRKAGPGRSRR